MQRVGAGGEGERGSGGMMVHLEAAGMGASAAVATGWSVRSRSGVASWLAPSTVAAPTPSPSDDSSSPATSMPAV